jgi:hypothetical protein
MKNKLTKIYNIFKQIENLNGNVGWDQTKSFYYFYENNKLVDCWKLLYGLFCENKNLKPSVFGITLLELRKYSNGFSVIYEFEELNEIPILVATFSRNGKHQISGKVKVEETSVSEAKVVEFVDGVNVDEDFDDEGSPANEDDLQFILKSDLSFATNFNNLLKKHNVDLNWVKIYLIKLDELTINELKDFEFVEDRIETHKSDYEDVLIIQDRISKNFDVIETYFESNYWKHAEKYVATDFGSYDEAAAFCKDGNYNIRSNDNIQSNDVEIDFLHVDDLDLSLLVYNNLVVCFHNDNDELIEIKNESEVQEYLELYNDNRLFIFKNELADKGISENFKEELTGKCPSFNIAGVIPDGLYSTSDCILFLDYLNNECALKGVFHPDDSFQNYCDSDGKQIFTKNQIELYSKYLDDMFEMDSDGNSEFVKIGYEDVYDFCMNYGNKENTDDSEIKDKLFEDELESAKYIEKYLRTPSKKGSKIFFIIGSEAKKDFEIDEIIDAISQENSSPSFIRGEIIGNNIYFYEIHVSKEPNIVLNDYEETMHFKYDITKNLFTEIEGYADERAELESGEDSWNCAELIIDIISEEEQDWKSTTPAELKQFFAELKLDYQFNENSEDYLGFINIDTENDMTENYSVMKYIVNNTTKAEKYANFYGLTIQSAQEGELIVSIMHSIDSNLEINNISYYVTLIQNPKNENKYNLKFYSDVKRLYLVGECELSYKYPDFPISDFIKWLSPTFEKNIDPEGNMYEVDDEIFEMIQALEIKKNR